MVANCVWQDCFAPAGLLDRSPGLQGIPPDTCSMCLAKAAPAAVPDDLDRNESTRGFVSDRARDRRGHAGHPDRSGGNPSTGKRPPRVVFPFQPLCDGCGMRHSLACLRRRLAGGRFRRDGLGSACRGARRPHRRPAYRPRGSEGGGLERCASLNRRRRRDQRRISPFSPLLTVHRRFRKAEFIGLGMDWQRSESSTGTGEQDYLVRLGRIHRVRLAEPGKSRHWTAAFPRLQDVPCRADSGHLDLRHLARSRAGTRAGPFAARPPPRLPVEYHVAEPSRAGILHRDGAGDDGGAAARWPVVLPSHGLVPTNTAAVAGRPVVPLKQHAVSGADRGRAVG